LEQDSWLWEEVMAETVTLRFKALFGEQLLSRKPEWLDAEQLTKAFIYNMILNAVLPYETMLQQERGDSNHRS
jgi:hypothetical protein